MKSVAGGATGLLTVTWKQFGAGEERQLIPEYRMVTANHCITRTLRLLRDRRAAATADTAPLADEASPLIRHL